MASKRTRLDRYLSIHTGISRRSVKGMLAQARIRVDGQIATDVERIVDEFSHVMVDGQLLQANRPSYVMLHKPIGVVSATKDTQHQTVIDLLDRPDRANLHIVGRLDLNSSGLLLLTNDGRWSRHLTAPEHKVPKLYRVTLKQPLTEAYIRAFADGMYFPYENATTRPAQLKILSDYVAEVTLFEGRYHQIKRMFGRFQNPVIALHRLAIGNLSLDATLALGQSRDLTEQEVSTIDLR